MRIRALLFITLASVGANAAAEESVCEGHELGGALDFWVGEWRVTSLDGETVYGSNRIEKALGGCAIFEHWTSARGGEGKSLFFLDAREGTWEQIWVTPDTARPGGLKHKTLIAGAPEGGVRFQGEYSNADGAPMLDRTTLVPHDRNAVRQTIEISVDNGAAWRTVFDAVYRPTEQTP